MEACRIVIFEKSFRTYDVGAPMKHKELCYEILRDAKRVIEKTSGQHFHPFQRSITIVMDMTGTVDVSAPLPPLAKCEEMLRAAALSIQRFNDIEAPAQQPFSDILMGPPGALH